MTEMLAPPDVEPAVVAILTRDGGPWVATRYADYDAGSIRVSATGGPQPTSLVAVEQTILVECWHDDEGTALGIARRAWADLAAAPGATVAGVDVKYVSSTMPNNNPDVNRPNLRRFQFLTSIHTRLAPLEA